MIIKVCPDPHCDAVWHHCPKEHTRCKDCGGNIIVINQDTYWTKFALHFAQYNFNTGEFYRPVDEMIMVADQLPPLNQPVWALVQMTFKQQAIVKLRRIPSKDIDVSWQWSSVNINSYFTKKVIGWLAIQ
ncbi:MAG TPA: hypothetical protein PKY29_04305 [Ferruginibacter sp.]|nr:hypothetical protein [Ferruginibacter sp.]HRQ20510.1 hypothetical protein [Ferruginibacter sp.]